MTTFNESRRQRFLDLKSFEFYSKLLEESIEIRRPKIQNKDTDLRVLRSASWCIATSQLELLILKYTAGSSIEKTKEELPTVIASFDHYHQIEEPKFGKLLLDLGYIEGYVYVMWLLSLCTLLDYREGIPKILAWVDLIHDENRGQDGLFELIVKKLTGTCVEVERVLLHPDYVNLAKATVVPDDEKPGFMFQFLEKWYVAMKDCYWRGSHKDKEGSSYFGYWAFEAALVTYLWKIDDTRYRDHLYYPKDLIGFARTQSAFEPIDADQPDNQRLRCEGGRPCPKDGWWWSPAAGVEGRRQFKKGEIMPIIDSDYGDTIWQWDERQD